MGMTLKEISEKTAADSDYRKKVIANPKGELKAAGIPVPDAVEIVALENAGGTLHAVIPAQSDAGRFYDIYLKNPLVAGVTNKAWTDAEFKKRLFANPKAAIMEVTGQAIPANLKIELHENTATKLFVVLPDPESAELDDAALERVAGGAGKIPFDPSKFPQQRSGPAPSGGSSGGSGGRSKLPPNFPTGGGGSAPPSSGGSSGGAGGRGKLPPGFPR